MPGGVYRDGSLRAFVQCTAEILRLVRRHRHGGMDLFRLLQEPAGRMASVFLASVLVVFLSRLCAVWESCPVTIFMVAGLFPLVPGAGIYWTVYELVMKNVSEAISRGFVALQDAVAIVLGIIAVFELPQKVFSIAGRKGKKIE